VRDSRREAEQGGEVEPTSHEGHPRHRLAGRVVLSLVVALAVGLAGGGTARGEEPSFGDHDIQTLLYIAKSDDKNRVDYGMRLDERCAPRRDQQPVFAYWREFEKAPPVRVHPLGPFEFLAYGILRQLSSGRGRGGYQHAIRLRQLQRDLFITTRKRASGGCEAEVRTRIAGRDGVLVESAFIQLGPLGSVRWVDLHGRSAATGEPVTERLKP
jgi:hypothetical protein